MYDIDVLTYDLETSYGKYKKRVGSPFSPDMKVCSSGWKADALDTEVEYYVKEKDGNKTGGHGSHSGKFVEQLKRAKFLVGANIKFDNLWYWKEIRVELKRGLKIWDVLYVHYLLTGQLYNNRRPERYRCSLNAVAGYYGFPLKLDKVKALWDAGVRTEDIDEDLLLEYQAYDVELTEMVFREQVKEIRSHGGNRFVQIMERMEGLLATTEMEYNGLHIDTVTGEVLRRELEAEYNILGTALTQQLPSMPDEHVFNWGSSDQVAALLFGGRVSFTRWIQHRDPEGNLLYCNKTVKRPIRDAEGNATRYKGGLKKGQIKYKNHTVPDMDKPKGKQTKMSFSLPGIITPREEWETDGSKAARKDDPTLPMKCGTGKEVMEDLENMDTVDFVKDFIKWKAIDKDLGTYYERAGKGMLTLVHDDGIIHHGLNHTIAVTGRLSASNPNCQNIPSKNKSQIKKVFNSRWLGGVVGETDYSQLEVVTKAVLSMDRHLRRDLLAGVDFHCKNLAMSRGLDYEYVYNECHVNGNKELKDGRQDIKAYTFQNAYGGGVALMAKSTGLTEQGIKDLLDAEAKEYPQAAAFNENVSKEVHETKMNTKMRSDPSGYPLRAGYYKSITGTWYSFLESESPQWKQKQGDFTGIKPTILKNYPGQGLGGEIMQIGLGRVFRWLINSEYDADVKMTNTVHDCCWNDYRNIAVAVVVVPQIEAILEDVSPYWLKKLGVDWEGMPFPVETEIGNNMFDLMEVHEYVEQNKS